jgi:hypothetical protein
VSEWQEAQSNSERLANGDDSSSSRNLKALSECGARYWSRVTQLWVKQGAKSTPTEAWRIANVITYNKSSIVG